MLWFSSTSRVHSLVSHVVLAAIGAARVAAEVWDVLHVVAVVVEVVVVAVEATMVELLIVRGGVHKANGQLLLHINPPLQGYHEN